MSNTVKLFFYIFWIIRYFQHFLQRVFKSLKNKRNLNSLCIIKEICQFDNILIPNTSKFKKFLTAFPRRITVFFNNLRQFYIMLPIIRNKLRKTLCKSSPLPLFVPNKMPNSQRWEIFPCIPVNKILPFSASLILKNLLSHNIQFRL